MVEPSSPGIEHFFCHNSQCPDHGKRGHGNVYFRGWSGRDKHIRMVYCRTCKRSYSQRKGTALERSQLPTDKVVSVLDHLREGCGVRATSRLTGVSRDTVARYLARTGDQSKQLHDELVAISPSTREVQFDEKWNFVGTKEKNCDPDDPRDDDLGDDWDHTAVDPEHRLLLAVVPGERCAENCQKVVQEVYDRTGGKGAMLLTSDAYPAYATAIEEVYGVWVQPERKPGPGRPPGPRRELPAGLVYATVCKKRAKGRVVEVIRSVVFGLWCLLECWLRRSGVSNTINTSFVERNNATDRRQNGRKQRKTYGFSRDKRMHDAATYFVSYSYNFCWSVRTLRVQGDEGWQARTPAMAAGLADHVWSLREWLTYPAKPCLPV